MRRRPPPSRDDAAATRRRDKDPLAMNPRRSAALVPAATGPIEPAPRARVSDSPGLAPTSDPPTGRAPTNGRAACGARRNTTPVGQPPPRNWPRHSRPNSRQRALADGARSAQTAQRPPMPTTTRPSSYAEKSSSPPAEREDATSPNECPPPPRGRWEMAREAATPLPHCRIVLVVSLVKCNRIANNLRA